MGSVLVPDDGVPGFFYDYAPDTAYAAYIRKLLQMIYIWRAP